MNLLRVSITQLLMCFCSIGLSQSSPLFSDSFPADLPVETRFSMYLDSANKYLYRDLSLTNKILVECQLILDNGADIQDSIQFDFIRSKIDFHHEKGEPLIALKFILAGDALAFGDKVSKKQLGAFNYLKSLTYESVGDLEAAQKGYYYGVKQSRADKDTMALVNNLFSLGQLLHDEEEYAEAIKHYREILAIAKAYSLPESKSATTNFELAVIFTELGELNTAKEHLSLAANYLEGDDLGLLRPKLYKEKGRVHLLMNEIDSAEFVLTQMTALGYDLNDENYVLNENELKAILYRAKKMYQQALMIYQNEIAKTDSKNIARLLDAYENAHELSSLMKDDEAAYSYLLKHSELETKKRNEEKRQKTKYLKTKFDAGQKEKDNAILKAELYMKQAEQKLLFGGLGLSALLLLALFAALYQKAKYSKLLEKTVFQRTENLRESNMKLKDSNIELEELNNILSHDLIEPLRSIVSFSELAKRDIADTVKATTYINIVNKSGRQLNQLIDAVRILRDTKSMNADKHTMINVKELFAEIVNQVQSKFPDKSINIITEVPETIKGPAVFYRFIFKEIIDNSTKFNKNKNVEIQVKHSKKNGTAAFVISDNGIGVEGDYYQHIFGMFKRLNNRDEYEGPGLGLNIAKRLTEKMGGSISVIESKIGEGTAIEVSYPSSE